MALKGVRITFQMSHAVHLFVEAELRAAIIRPIVEAQQALWDELARAAPSRDWAKVEPIMLSLQRSEEEIRELDNKDWAEAAYDVCVSTLDAESNEQLVKEADLLRDRTGIDIIRFLVSEFPELVRIYT